MTYLLIKARSFGKITKLEVYDSSPTHCKVGYYLQKKDEHGLAQTIRVFPEKLLRVCKNGQLPHIFGDNRGKSGIFGEKHGRI